MATTFTVGIAQVDCRLGDVAANLAIYERALREAKGRGIDLLVFPELSLTGYRLPWPAGQRAHVTQNYADHGTGQIDFWLLGDDVTAAKDGEIVYLNDSHTANGCSIDFARYNNVVVIRHAVGEYTIYAHVAAGSVPSAMLTDGTASAFSSAALTTVLALTVAPAVTVREKDMGYRRWIVWLLLLTPPVHPAGFPAGSWHCADGRERSSPSRYQPLR